MDLINIQIGTLFNRASTVLLIKMVHLKEWQVGQQNEKSEFESWPCALCFLNSTPVIYSCSENDCPTKPYATMLKSIIGNGGSWSLIEALGVSTIYREKAQTNEFMPYLFLLVNTVNLNQSTPNSFYSYCQSALSRTLLYAFVRQPLSKQLYIEIVCNWCHHRHVDDYYRSFSNLFYCSSVNPVI